MDPVPFIFSGLLLLPLRGLRLRYAIWAFHDFAGSPRCVLLRRGWTLAFWSPGVGSRTLPSRLCGICGSFGLRFALSCFVNSRPGGRSRGFGPRVRWAWACGWDAGGPLFTSLRGSGDAWARGFWIWLLSAFRRYSLFSRLRRGLPRWSGRLRRSPPLSYSSSRRRPSFFTHYTLWLMLLCLAVRSSRTSTLYGLQTRSAYAILSCTGCHTMKGACDCTPPTVFAISFFRILLRINSNREFSMSRNRTSFLNSALNPILHSADTTSISQEAWVAQPRSAWPVLAFQRRRVRLSDG